MRAAVAILLSTLPLVFGWCVGRAVSFDMWGYADDPPRIDVGDARLTGLSFVRSRDPDSLVTLERAAMVAAMSPERCTRKDPSDCTLGRTLWSILRDGSGVSRIPESLDPLAAIVAAEKTGRLFTGSGGRCGTTLVAELALTDSKKGLLVGHQSCELFEDRHRYTEVLLVDGIALQGVAYSFDVAGIEFATPTVLKVASVLLFATTFGCGMLAACLAFARRRPVFRLESGLGRE